MEGRHYCTRRRPGTNLTDSIGEAETVKRIAFVTSTIAIPLRASTTSGTSLQVEGGTEKTLGSHHQTRTHTHTHSV